MKTHIFIATIAILALSLISCNRGKLKELEQKNQQLTEINQLQDSVLNDFMMYFNEFEDNLDLIKERENIISVSTRDPEFSEDRKDKVIEDISMINSLLVQNRSIIDSLSHRLEGSEGKLGELRRSISRLNKRLDEKTEEIASLKTNLEEMNFTVASLNTQVDTLTMVSKSLRSQTKQQAQTIEEQTDQISQQTEQIAHQTEKINTAYFITGTAKELKDQNILSKEGGVIGIGSTKKLREDFDRSSFSKVDITEMNSIPLSAKKAEILTAHPTGSYQLKAGENEKGVETLEITDPESFWSTTKYLVVVVN